MARARKLNGIPMMTQLRGHRIAGHGCLEDDYSERSGGKSNKKLNPYYKSTLVRFPSDNKDPESLNGECIIVQEGRKKDG